MQSDINMAPQRANNLRTATILGSIAAVFFCGIIVAQYSGAPEVAIGVVGVAMLGFIGVSIGRSAAWRGRK